MPTQRQMIIFLCLNAMMLSCIAQCGAILNQSMITFQMMGATQYTPDKGGASLMGYKLRIGFSKYQWLGVRFQMNNNKDDLLVMQIDQFYTQSSNSLRNGHKVSIQDYYISSDLVNLDRNNNNDISSFQYVQTKDYYIDIIRYYGSNDGEDWNGAAYRYSLADICFYTSEQIFDPDKMFQGIFACYSYEIKNFISSFKGQKLKTFRLNGYVTQINGWIDGPYVTGNLYFYQLTPLYTYTRTPAFVLEIGTTQNQKGQDFYVVSSVQAESGDYYGKSPTNMSQDTSVAGGFKNGIFTLEDWNADPAKQISEFSSTALGLTFNRNISTYDSFDKEMKSTVVFCLYMYTEGTIVSQLSDKGCQAVELSYHYPRIGLPLRPTFETLHLFQLLWCTILALLLL